MRIGMVIDLEKCLGCRSCVVACKQHNSQPPGNWWNRVFTPGSKYHLTAPDNVKTHFLPVSCQHCDNAPCEKACPVGATYRTDDGSILVDFERCIGCRICMAACPYGVRQFNWENPEKTHENVEYIESYTYGYPKEHRKDGRLVYMPLRFKGVVEKCTLCVQYRDVGLDPACVQGCPGNARFVGDLDDSSSNVSKMVRDMNGFTLLPEYGTKPNVYYLPAKRREVEQ